MAADWPRKKPLLLLKVLLSERGRGFSQDQLIDAVFANLDADKAVKNLHVRIIELRRMLEPELKKGAESAYIRRVERGTYCFSAEVDCRVDTEMFQERA